MISNRCARKSLVTNCNSIISKNYLRFLVDSNDSTYKRKIQFKQFINDNIIWITTIFVTFIFVLFTKHSSGHSRFGFEFFSLLLTIKLLSNFNINKYLILLCHGLLLITIMYVIKFSYINYHEYQNCINQIKNINNNIILTHEMKCPSCFERLIIRFIDGESTESYNGFMNQTWIANRYKKSSLVFIPQSLYIQIINIPQKFNNQFYTTDNLPVYVMKTEKKISSAKFILKKTDYNKLPFYLKLIADKMERYNADSIISNKVNTIKIVNSNYIFIGKNNLIKDRVLNININNTNYNILVQ